MVKSQLRVYTRLKPIHGEEQEVPHRVVGGRSIEIQYTRSNKSSPVHDRHEFHFSRVLSTESRQSEVFDVVAKPVVLSCLNGYNGTVFAYGQTGSGKTYTMSGTDAWEGRGIIPRVLSLVFREFEARKEDVEYSASISYMEIYNENAYDLLEKRDLDQGIEKWNKIQLFEDEDGNFNLRGISMHSCRSEAEGVQLMMTGNFVRQVSSTPMNQCSSRSHCVFTINIEGKELKSSLRFTAKLHLVDLAGSERISKTQVEGNLLN
jgi:kinesin family protein 6/9